MRRTSVENQLRDSSRSGYQRWVRNPAKTEADYPSLMLVDRIGTSEIHTERTSDRKYTVRVGKKIFAGDDPKALLRLAVAARRSRPERSNWDNS